MWKMAQNLNYSGDDDKGNRTFTHGWCYGVGGTDWSQHQDSTTCEGGYGRIYSWEDAVSSNTPVVHRGLCPKGWHVPQSKDWDTLNATIRKISNADVGFEGRYLKAKIPGNDSWNAAEFNQGDSFGFSILPTGHRYYDGNWHLRDSIALFWSTRSLENEWIYGRYTAMNHVGFEPFSMDELSGFASLRCPLVL